MNIIKNIKERMFFSKFNKMVRTSIEVANAHGYDLVLNNNINNNIDKFIEFVKYRSNEEKKNKTNINILSLSIIEPLSCYFCLLNIINNNNTNTFEITRSKKTKHIIIFDNKYDSGLEVDAYQLIYDVILNNAKAERIKYIIDFLYRFANDKTDIDFDKELNIINNKTLINK